MRTLYLATRNKHKIREIREILGDGFDYRSLADLPQPPEVIEDRDSFDGNARKKAAELAQWISRLARIPRGDSIGTSPEAQEYVLADDSGLEVDALNGAPGVHSARFAAIDSGSSRNSTDSSNNAKLIHLLQQVPLQERTARFRCVLALSLIPKKLGNVEPGSAPSNSDAIHTELFDGACEGHISESPSGGGGFGYDPLFIPAGFSQSFAELGASTKNRISHRSAALSKLQQFLSDKTQPGRFTNFQAHSQGERTTGAASY